MDLSKLATKEKSEKGARLYFVAPDGRETTIFMDVLGQDSKKYLNRINESVLESVNKRKDTDKKEVDMDDLLEGQEKQLETLTMMVVGWGDHEETKDKDPKKGKIKDTLTWGEEELKCSVKNILRVFEACPWMKEQVNAFMGKRANFL